MPDLTDDVFKDAFTVSGIEYDPIGNITKLSRRGIIGCGDGLVAGDIDILTYDYYPDDTHGSTSLLKHVTDEAENPLLAELGVRPTEEGNDYGYDAAGRLTSDPHRGLTIEYNLLDLPRKITGADGGVIEITYDATGRKWLHRTSKITRRYAGSLTFEKAADASEYTLEAAATGDGRIVYDSKTKELYPEYHHKDHLGNVRVVFNDGNQDQLVEIIGQGNEVTQVNDFYPFGLAQEGAMVEMAGSMNRYRYNSKELVSEVGWYDYGARWYDPAVGRWNAVDPLAEEYARFSGYNYTLNNPIKYIDPNGLYVDNSPGGSSRNASMNNTSARKYYQSVLDDIYKASKKHKKSESAQNGYRYSRVTIEVFQEEAVWIFGHAPIPIGRTYRLKKKGEIYLDLLAYLSKDDEDNLYWHYVEDGSRKSLSEDFGELDFSIQIDVTMSEPKQYLPDGPIEQAIGVNITIDESRTTSNAITIGFSTDGVVGSGTRKWGSTKHRPLFGGQTFLISSGKDWSIQNITRGGGHISNSDGSILLKIKTQSLN